MSEAATQDFASYVSDLLNGSAGDNGAFSLWQGGSRVLYIEPETQSIWVIDVALGKVEVA